MWVKYRAKWNHGISEEWIYHEMNDRCSVETIETHIEEQFRGDGFYVEDGYRGYEYDIIDKPPKEYIEKQIKDLSKRISWMVNRKSELEKLLFEGYR